MEKEMKILIGVLIIGMIGIITGWIYSYTGKHGKQIMLDLVNATEKQDGPYVFIEDNALIKMRIDSVGEVKRDTVNVNKFITSFRQEPAVYNNVQKFAALSDVHGQFNIFSQILRQHRIVDQDLNWSYSTGHLVIVGDIVNKGHQVTECLWLVYKLEQQAEKAGGKVHYLLGNHEVQFLQGDVSDMNSKYTNTAERLEKKPADLLGKNTVLGRWLRKKNAMMKINDYLFVHAGISSEFIQMNVNMNRANQLYIESMEQSLNQFDPEDLHLQMYKAHSPLWYRGFFSSGFKERQMDQILSSFQVDHIVVGHTSQNKVIGMYNNKLYAVDSSIKEGRNGEILLVENGIAYRGKFNGQRQKL